MKRIAFLVIAVVAAGVVASSAPASGHADGAAAPAFAIPSGYRDWKLISVAHEEGTLNDLRAILGNDVAIKAEREGKLPFPDGTIIARIAWGLRPVGGKRSSLWPSPIFRGRATQERSSFYGEGLKKIRFDGGAGGSLNLNPPARRRKPALPATRSLKLATLSSTVTRVKPRVV